MPEVVYPSHDDNGNAREWKDMFPELPDTHYGWKVINSTLEAIAINNRFGGKTVDELRSYLINQISEQVNDLIASKPEYDEEFFSKLMGEYGMQIRYTNLVFDNLGGAYREYKK